MGVPKLLFPQFPFISSLAYVVGGPGIVGQAFPNCIKKCCIAPYHYSLSGMRKRVFMGLTKNGLMHVFHRY